MHRPLATLLLALLGCSGSTPEPKAKAKAAAPAEGAAKADKARKGRKKPAPVLRGMLSFTEEGGRFRPCDADEAVPVDDATGKLAELVGSLTPDPGAEVLAVLEGKAAAERVAVSGWRSLFFGADCSRPAVEARARAFGNEPFWSLTVNEKDAVLTRPDDPGGAAFDVGTPTFRGMAMDLTLTGRDGGSDLQLTVEPELCRDTMADAVYAFKAVAVWGDERLEGCAEQGAKASMAP